MLRTQCCEPLHRRKHARLDVPASVSRSNGIALFPAGVLPRQEAAGERAERDEADTVTAKEGEKLFLSVASEEVILVLRGGGLDGPGFLCQRDIRFDRGL